MHVKFPQILCVAVMCVFRLKESIGWNQAWMSPYLESVVDRIALNAKMANPGHDGCSRMIAASYGSIVQLWQISDNGQSTREIGWYPVLLLESVRC